MFQTVIQAIVPTVFAMPSWLGMIETLTFIVMIATVVYNRVMTLRKIHERTGRLEMAFEQYQKDMSHYLQICELCRGEVRKHHEDETERHVTPDMREQIKVLVEDVREIKRHLMQHPIQSK